MNLPENTRRCVKLGKVFAGQGMVVARQIVGQVSIEAVHQAEIAKPIIRKAIHKTHAEFRRQATAAKPVIHEATRRSGAFIMSKAVGANRLIRGATHGGLRQAISLTQQLNKRYPLAGTTRLALVAGLIGAMSLTGLAFSRFSARELKPVAVVDASMTHGDSDGVLETTVDIIGTEHQPSVPELVQTSFESATQNFAVEETQRDSGLEQQRLQAQAELDQAAAEYDYAMQIWNAEVAACQSGRAPGYTAHQRGHFSAMGISMSQQPQRQPDQALFHAASQAEQRYVQARDYCQQFGQAQ